MSHFLQSPAWQQFQEARGNTTFMRSGEGWHYLAIKESAGGFSRLYCPYGPVVSSLDSLDNALADLQAVAREYRVDYLRVQPTGADISLSDLMVRSLRPIHYSQPIRTWLLDLSPSLDELYAQMKQNTRNICRNFYKKGLSYEKSYNPADISVLTPLLRGVASHNNITVHDDQYFALQAETFLPTKNGALHCIRYAGNVIAAALTYYTEDTAIYAHAAADFEHRSLGASTALLGEIIRDAKENGFTCFDFYGIAPNDDPEHKQAGLTRFKQSFGGYEHRYVPTCEQAVRPLQYRVYRFLRKIRGLNV